MNKPKNTLTSGFLGDNTVLSGLMVISPVIMCGDTLKNALALVYAFSLITFFSVMISSFVPKRLPYAVKIIIYAVISALIYIPVKLLAQEIYPEAIGRTGIYFPLLAVNSLIVHQTEAKFFRMRKLEMTGSLVFYILGFDAVMLLTGVIRELFAYGTVYNRMVDMNTLISGIAQPFGGFIFLGLLCGIYRKIRSMAAANENAEKEAENVSDN
ncbi:MAG: electron transport complex subunit E [Ruminococcus sp.]|nr:electron transport complex subunit E [Ruminococcus sp.]